MKQNQKNQGTKRNDQKSLLSSEALLKSQKKEIKDKQQSPSIPQQKQEEEKLPPVEKKLDYIDFKIQNVEKEEQQKQVKLKQEKKETFKQTYNYFQLMKDINNDMYFIDLVQKRKLKSVDQKKNSKRNIFHVMKKGEHVADYKQQIPDSKAVTQQGKNNQGLKQNVISSKNASVKPIKGLKNEEISIKNEKSSIQSEDSELLSNHSYQKAKKNSRSAYCKQLFQQCLQNLIKNMENYVEERRRLQFSKYYELSEHYINRVYKRIERQLKGEDIGSMIDSDLEDLEIDVSFEILRGKLEATDDDLYEMNLQNENTEFNTLGYFSGSGKIGDDINKVLSYNNTIQIMSDDQQILMSPFYSYMGQQVNYKDDQIYILDDNQNYDNQIIQDQNDQLPSGFYNQFENQLEQQEIQNGYEGLQNEQQNLEFNDLRQNQFVNKARLFSAPSHRQRPNPKANCVQQELIQVQQNFG